MVFNYSAFVYSTVDTYMYSAADGAQCWSGHSYTVKAAGSMT